MTRPLIGITVDNVDSSIASGKYESNLEYSRAVAEAGGLPILLPQEVELAEYYVSLCDGLMLTGGDDVRTEAFGVPAHPQSRCIDPQRQAFDLALLDALAKKPQRPVLGVCMGMQLMSLHAGGRMNQHLPDTLANAVEIHQNNHPHGIVVHFADTALRDPAGRLAAERQTGEPRSTPEFPSNHEVADSSNQTVVSSHHQAVEDAGRLRVIAHSVDGVIEAVDDPDRPYYVGVQWHPERDAGYFNQDLIRRFVDTCTRRHAYFP